MATVAATALDAMTATADPIEVATAAVVVVVAGIRSRTDRLHRHVIDEMVAVAVVVVAVEADAGPRLPVATARP